MVSRREAITRIPVRNCRNGEEKKAQATGTTGRTRPYSHPHVGGAGNQLAAVPFCCQEPVLETAIGKDFFCVTVGLCALAHRVGKAGDWEAGFFPPLGRLKDLSLTVPN